MSNQELIQSLANQEKTLLAEYAARLKQLQSAIPEKLTLLHTIKTSDMMELESYFHQMFAASRARSEWFELSNDDVSVFMNYSELNNG